MTHTFSTEGHKSTTVVSTDPTMTPADAPSVDVVGSTRLGQLLHSETRCDSGIASLEDVSSLQQVMSRLMTPALDDITDGRCIDSQRQRFACVESCECLSPSNASDTCVVERDPKEALGVLNNSSLIAPNAVTVGVDVSETQGTAAVWTCSNVDSASTQIDPVTVNQLYHSAFRPNDDGDT